MILGSSEQYVTERSDYGNSIFGNSNVRKGVKVDFVAKVVSMFHFNLSINDLVFEVIKIDLN